MKTAKELCQEIPAILKIEKDRQLTWIISQVLAGRGTVKGTGDGTHLYHHIEKDPTLITALEELGYTVEFVPNKISFFRPTKIGYVKISACCGLE